MHRSVVEYYRQVDGSWKVHCCWTEPRFQASPQLETQLLMAMGMGMSNPSTYLDVLSRTLFFSLRGVSVSIGHTAATYDVAKRAIENGLQRGTHTFNAMPPIHQRTPGPIPALFEASNVDLEFIVDGHHVHPSVLALAIRQIGPERAILITDCTDVAGQGEGQFTRWEGTEVVKDGQSRTHAGSLAGSVLRRTRVSKTSSSGSDCR